MSSNTFLSLSEYNHYPCMMDILKLSNCFPVITNIITLNLHLITSRKLAFLYMNFIRAIVTGSLMTYYLILFYTENSIFLVNKPCTKIWNTLKWCYMILLLNSEICLISIPRIFKFLEFISHGNAYYIFNMLIF